MFKTKINDHELSRRHFRQVVCRSRALQAKLRAIWAVTWRPGDHKNSFLGQNFRPLGSALMMVQISYPREGTRDGVGLFGIAAQVLPQTATVTYEELRLFHDFGRTPFVGGRGPILDPSDERPGGRGNASWVRLALEVDSIRQRMDSRQYRLPVVPTLPAFYFGFGSKEAARFEVTDDLCRRAAMGLKTDWKGNSLEDLGNLNAKLAEVQGNAFAALPGEQQEQRLRAAWDSAFIAPSDPANDTGLWLLPHELTTDVYRSVRLFEHFGGLVGAHVFNPARLFTDRTIPNPAIEVAKELGFDLVGDLAALAGTSEGSPEYNNIEQRLIGLVPALRQRTGASTEIADQDLLNSICQPELPLAIEPPLGSLPEQEQVRMMRTRLKPHLSECCADADLLEAVLNPSGPLLAAGLCRVQSLFRNTHIPLPEAMEFSAEVLRRRRVKAKCWFENRLNRESKATVVNQEPALAA